MRILKNTLLIMLLLAPCQLMFAQSSLLFNVSSSGTPDSVSITLCLNGKGPLSCQQFTVTALTLSILTTIPNHSYPLAGIKINTPNYTIANVGVDCTPYDNGYCLFSVSNSTPKAFSIQTDSAAIAMVAAGSYQNTTFTSYPLLATSSDSGASWVYTIDSSTPTLPSDFATAGETGAALNSVSCSGHNCVAAGNYTSTNGSVIYPLLATSSDGGASWAYTLDSTTSTSVPDNYSNSGTFNGVSCSGLNCVAAGSYSPQEADPYPLIATSSNGGTSWLYTLDGTTTGLPEDYYSTGIFNSVSCSGLNCIAAGNYYTLSYVYPLLVKSSDGGASWVSTLYSTIPTPPTGYGSSGIFHSVSCSGLNCVAAGSYNDLSEVTYPLIATSADGGATWSYTLDAETTGLPEDYDSTGIFNSVSCSGVNCVAAGSYLNLGGVPYPLIATSADGGASWTYTLDSAMPTLPSDFYAQAGSTTSTLTSVSCSGLHCVAAGNYTSTNGSVIYPLLATSNNGGASWVYSLDSTTSPSAPSNLVGAGIFNSVRCVGVHCVAAGNYNGTNSSSQNTLYPLLATSSDGGVSWVYTLDSTTPTSVPSEDFGYGRFNSNETRV